MKKTNFTFFKDTPFIDFQNTVHFSGNGLRDQFFLQGNHYETLDLEGRNFNFIRDRSTLDVPIKYGDMQGVNYCTFLSEHEESTRYYAYVMKIEYIQPGTTRVYLLVDGIMTFTQGSVLEQLTNLHVMRSHLSKYQYNQREFDLKNNGDILTTYTKAYHEEFTHYFKEFDLIIQCTADLTRDFGTVDNPKIETSEGQTFDNLQSPVNLYVVKEEHFKDFMKKLAPYPWIAQNIKSIILVPRSFISGGREIVAVHSKFGFKYLERLIDNGVSSNVAFTNELQDFNLTMEDLYRYFKLDPEQEKHLLRNEYGTVEVYSWDGQQLFIDLGQLNNKDGIKWETKAVMGYHNEVAVYIRNYKSRHNIGGGSFLNDAITFKNFDDIPILVDNFGLSMAKGANRRELAESKLVSKRVENVLDKDANLKDRFFNATSLMSNLSIGNLFGKFNDEHEFYRNQRAEFADLALETPTITNQTNSNALQLSGNFFGLTMKLSRPSLIELNKIRKYYQSFGFEIDEYGSDLKGRVHTQSIANYVQFSGSWSIPGVDVAIIEQMKAQFENGVRLWHDNGTPNPMEQDLLNNRMIF